MNNRRALIAPIVAGAVLVGAAGIGIVYFVVFAGSSPQKLALSSPTPSTSASAASSASTLGPGTWTVTSGSQAGYRVREQLASLPAPSDAVGRTSAVTGTMTLAQSASGYTVTTASFTVDVSKLTSDQSRRDQRIHSQGLESDRFPTASFGIHLRALGSLTPCRTMPPWITSTSWHSREPSDADLGRRRRSRPPGGPRAGTGGRGVPRRRRRPWRRRHRTVEVL